MESFQKVLLSNIIAVFIGSVMQYFNDLLKLIPVPELYLYIDQKLLLGPPYLFIIILTVMIYFIINFTANGLIINFDIGKVCKQFRFLSCINCYSSNGISKYEIIKSGKNEYMKVTFQNFINNNFNKNNSINTYESGIIFVKPKNYWPLPKGFLISNKKILKFEIMGCKGDEKLGVALKNTLGYELKIPLDILMSTQIQKDTWREVKIDLELYSHVIRSMREKVYLENFSFFTNSKLSNSEKQEFYLRNIVFE